MPRLSNFSNLWRVVSAALVCLAILAPAPSQSQTLGKLVSAKSPAADDGSRQKPATKKKKASKKSSNVTNKATFDRGSAETTAERTARLKRECKGGVNAGACAGYTR